VSGVASQAYTFGTTASTTVNLATRDVKILPRGYFSDDGKMEVTSTDNKPIEIMSVVFTTEIQQP